MERDPADVWEARRAEAWEGLESLVPAITRSGDTHLSLGVGAHSVCHLSHTDMRWEETGILHSLGSRQADECVLGAELPRLRQPKPGSLSALGLNPNMSLNFAI